MARSLHFLRSAGVLPCWYFLFAKFRLLRRVSVLSETQAFCLCFFRSPNTLSADLTVLDVITLSVAVMFLFQAKGLQTCLSVPRELLRFSSSLTSCSQLYIGLIDFLVCFARNRILRRALTTRWSESISSELYARQLVIDLVSWGLFHVHSLFDG